MKTILIADDHEGIRNILKDFFRTFNVYGVADGEEAIEKYANTRPDLIVLDFRMPGMNGLETAHKLREMSVEVPIVLFTMHGDSIPQDEISPQGINVVVLKPDLAELHRKVKSLLSEVKEHAGYSVSEQETVANK